MRILVVDDELLVAQTVSIILEKNGFEVGTCSSTDAALDSARQMPPVLQLCDIDMPERDGIDLMREFARTLPECPILVLTGSYKSLPSVGRTADSLTQQVRILIKPCTPAELLREARSLLRIA